MSKFREFIGNAFRVLRLAKKPGKDEFFFIAKVTAIGILLIGFLGYVIESIRWLFLK